MNEWARALPLFPEFLGILLWGAVTTIHITIGSFMLAVAIGLVLGLIQTFPARLPKIIIRIYIEVFRGVPVLTQLFVLYLPQLDQWLIVDYPTRCL